MPRAASLRTPYFRFNAKIRKIRSSVKFIASRSSGFAGLWESVGSVIESTAEGANRPESLRHPNRNPAPQRQAGSGKKWSYAALPVSEPLTEGENSLRYPGQRDGEFELKDVFAVTQKTCLYQAHIEAGGRMVDFAGWQMPVNYGSQIEEHHAVRRAVGMFDVSHMCAVDIAGPQADEFLRVLLANDVAKIKPGRVMYSCMLNPDGGVIDDLIVYRRAQNEFRTVVNAGTAEKDIAWMQKQAVAFDVTIAVRRDLGILALQGPQAKDKLAASGLAADFVAAALECKPFGCAFSGTDYLLGRTGYTGEDGFEIVAPLAEIPTIWSQLLAAGVAPCGLGARDTLRLEAGMALYGQDMDETVSPLAAGLGWTIAWEPKERDFIGRRVLEEQTAAQSQPKMIGLVLEDRGVLRAHQTVITDAGEGEITSGGFSPTLERSIALARVPRESTVSIGTTVGVEIRNKRLAARVVKYPFVRHGQSKID